MTAPQNHDFRPAFDLDPEIIYLNSGTHSLCPIRVTDAVVDHLRSCERNPTSHLMNAAARAWEIQKLLARYLGARPEDLILKPNVTAAMNTFILGIPLPSGPGEILVSDAEYGAVTHICRYRAQRSGLTLRAFTLPGRSAPELQALTEDRLVELISAELKPETRMLVLSHVTTGHGLKLPIARVARETRRRGILLAVDGAHATGAIPLDFSTLEDVDYYGGNLHKWIMGPKGTGFGWVHPRHHETLDSLEAGWTTFETGLHLGAFAPGHRFAQKHMLAASVDFAPFFALSEAFAFWQEHGAETIRARLHALQTHTAREMKATGWTWLAPAEANLRGPLLSFELPARLQAEGYGLMGRLLRERKLQIALSLLQGRWILRVSPHIYNTEDEISRAAGILAAL